MNCSDCPPVGYPTDKTRCAECPYRKYHSEWCDRINGGFECNCEVGDPPALTIDVQTAELKLAGWVHVRGHLWKAPVGGYFMGPHGAWLAMKRRENARNGK